MKKHIEVTKEMRDKLLKIFGCSRVWIWKALSYESDTPKCQRIRCAALKMGGRVVDGEDVEPVTEYERSGDVMVQRFGSRVRLVVDMVEGDGEWRMEVDGSERKRGSARISVADFMKVQAEAAMLARSL